MTIRVVLVDDQELVRAGLSMVLATRSGIEVVGEADDGDTALELLARVEADVVLMDVRMPRMSGVEATCRPPAGRGRHQGVDLDHLRSRRICLRGVAGRGEWIPAQGHPDR